MNPKCPKCGGEGWLDVSGKYQCIKCGHWFKPEVDPMSSPFESNARCRICGVPVSDHDFAIWKGYIGEHRPVVAEMNPFKSEAQRRYLWMHRPDIARRWSKRYGSRVQRNPQVSVGGRIGPRKPDDIRELIYLTMDELETATREQYPLVEAELDELAKELKESIEYWGPMDYIEQNPEGYTDTGTALGRTMSEELDEMARRKELRGRLKGWGREQNSGVCNICGADIRTCYCEKCSGIEQNPLTCGVCGRPLTIRTQARGVCGRCQKTLFGGPEQNPLTYHDYKEAIQGEGWASVDYADMITKADTEMEREALTHIKGEEDEHMDELIELLDRKHPEYQNNPFRKYEHNISRYYPTKEEAERFIEGIKAKGWVIAHFELTDHPLYGHKWWVDYRLP